MRPAPDPGASRRDEPTRRAQRVPRSRGAQPGLVGETGRVQERGVMLRADGALRRFFGAQLAGASEQRARRLRAAESDLLACLEEMAPLLLSDQERALLALERQFDPEGALARVANADAVLLLLPVFLDEPRWHGSDLEDRRLRIRLARSLADEIFRESAARGVDLGRAAWVVEAQVRHEIWMLQQEREATRGW